LFLIGLNSFHVHGGSDCFTGLSVRLPVRYVDRHCQYANMRLEIELENRRTVLLFRSYNCLKDFIFSAQLLVLLGMKMLKCISIILGNQNVSTISGILSSVFLNWTLQVSVVIRVSGTPSIFLWENQPHHIILETFCSSVSKQ
jgi:hypothetical protein